MTIARSRLDVRTHAVCSLSELPRWPFSAMFVLYPVWWALGLAGMMWIPLAGVMALYLIRRGGIEVPRGFGIWLMFLAMVMFSVIGIDTPGRLIGFVYRFAQYLAVTVVFVYAYNARTRLTIRWVLGIFTVYWVYVVVGGYASIAFPLFSFATPLSYVLPQGLLSNEVVSEMAFRRLTQHNPDSWLDLDPRPSAPFLYTNAWGNVYSMLLPLVICYLRYLRESKLFLPAILMVPASLVPAFLTLNRGMFIGLAVALVFVAIVFFIRGNVKVLLSLLLLAGVLGAAAAVLDVGDRLEERTEVSSSTEDRANLYEETFERSLESPLFGYGAPRPSDIDGAPSAGTQGQMWTIMFSNGFPALFLFLGWLVWTFAATCRARDPVRIGMNSVLLVIIVECAYYGVTPNGLIISMAVAGVLMRPPNGEHE